MSRCGRPSLLFLRPDCYKDKPCDDHHERKKMNFMSMVMTVLCMSVCVYVYFKVSKVEKSMILIRQTSLQLPSVEDVSKISMRCVKKQFEFARQKEIESRRIRAEQEQQQQRLLEAQRQHADSVVQDNIVQGPAEAAGASVESAQQQQPQASA